MWAAAGGWEGWRLQPLPRSCRVLGGSLWRGGRAGPGRQVLSHHLAKRQPGETKAALCIGLFPGGSLECGLRGRPGSLGFTVGQSSGELETGPGGTDGPGGWVRSQAVGRTCKACECPQGTDIPRAGASFRRRTKPGPAVVWGWKGGAEQQCKLWRSFSPVSLFLWPYCWGS